ncbi:MAG TPA: DUF397 domain-containing protein [Trebonia sp.]
MGSVTLGSHPAGSDEPTWVKSSLSFANGNCVEVAQFDGGEVGIRNSRHPDGPVLRFTADEWHAFIGGARQGEFDGFGK